MNTARPMTHVFTHYGHPTAERVDVIVLENGQYLTISDAAIALFVDEDAYLRAESSASINRAQPEDDEVVPEGWECPCGERRMDYLLPGEDAVIHCFTCDCDYAFETISEDGDASEVICPACGRIRQAKGNGPAVYRRCVQCQLEANERASDQDGTSGQDRESYSDDQDRESYTTA